MPAKRAEYNPEKFMQEVERRLEGLMSANSQYISCDGYWAINYSIAYGEGFVGNLQMRVLLHPSVGKRKNISMNIATGTDNEGLVDSLREKVEEFLESKGAAKSPSINHPESNRPRSEKNLIASLDCYLMLLKGNNPDYYNEVSRVYRGAFCASGMLMKTKNHRIIIFFRSLEEVESAKRSERIGTPVRFEITINTNNEDDLRKLIEVSEKHLELKGFNYQKIQNNIDENSPIPKNWVDLDHIGIPDRSPKIFHIVITKKDTKKGIPRIEVTSRTADRNIAEQMVGELKVYVGEILGSDTELTTAGINNFLKEKGFIPDTKEPAETQRFDIRLVPNYFGKIIAKLYTPRVSCVRGTERDKYSIEIRIASYLEQQEARPCPISLISMSSANDRGRAIEQATLLNDVVESLLIRHFRDNPDAKFLTYLASEGKKQVRKMQSQPDPTYSIDVLARELNASLSVDGYQSPNPLVGFIKGEIDKITLAQALDIPTITETLKDGFHCLRTGEGGKESTLFQAVVSGYIDFSTTYPQYTLWLDGDEILGIRPDTANFIDARTLREDILQRPIDFARDLMWKVEITPVDEQDKEGRQHIKLQAVRDFGEGLNLLNENNVIWNSPIENIFADTPEAAKRFKETVISVLLTGQSRYSNQQPDPSISVRRGVDNFGEPSTQLVLSESLRAGLQLPGIDIPTVSYTLNAIKSGRSIV